LAKLEILHSYKTMLLVGYCQFMPGLHLAYTHWRKVEQQLNPVLKASNFLAV